MIFFAHSVGDTQAVIDIVRHLKARDLPKPPEYIKIVLLGQAAHDIFFAKQPVAGMQEVQIYSIATHPALNFGLDVFKQNAFTLAQQSKMHEFLLSYIEEHESVFIGNPSLRDCQLPFDVAQFVAQQKNVRPVVYDEYLFEDPESVLYKAVCAREFAPLWVSLCDIALATERAEQRFVQELGSKAAFFVAGHRIIDNALREKSAEDQVQADIENARVHYALDLKLDQQFVFFSGSKDTELDKQVFVSALSHLRNAPNARLVLGMHPGHPQLLDYASDMIGQLRKSPELAQQVKIVIPNKLVNGKLLYEILIEKGLFDSQFCIIQRGPELSGNGLGNACNAAIGAVPGQLLFDTALRGGLAASGANPFMYLQGVGSGVRSFPAFFEVRGAAAAGRPTREECGVPAEPMVEVMAGRLLNL